MREGCRAQQRSRWPTGVASKESDFIERVTVENTREDRLAKDAIEEDHIIYSLLKLIDRDWISHEKQSLQQYSVHLYIHTFTAPRHMHVHTSPSSSSTAPQSGASSICAIPCCEAKHRTSDGEPEVCNEWHRAPEDRHSFAWMKTVGDAEGRQRSWNPVRRVQAAA